MKIRLDQINKVYKSGARDLAIIEDLSFEFESNCSVGVVGRSGVGKSSLLQLLGTLDLPSSGSIFFDDVEITGASFDQRARFRAQHIGFIFQFHHLLHEFSMLENVAMPLLIAGVAPEQASSQAEELLVRFGLQDRLTHFPGQLSGGEQQRVAIARALVHRPSIVLADEPTGNLDVATAEDITQVLFEVRDSFEASLIVVTHSRELAGQMSEVFEMEAGGALRPLSRT